MKKEDNKPISTLKLTLQNSEQNTIKPYLPDSLPKLNDPFKEEEFQKIHQQYLNEKICRKKEFQIRKRQVFGASSSEQDDVGASESDSDTQKRKSTLQEQRRFRQSQKLRQAQLQAALEQKCQIFFSIKKIKQSWTQQSLSFQQQSLIISEKHYFLKQFHKIKIIQGLAISDCHRIKLSCIDETEIFIAASNRPFKELPLNYYIFAYVIEQKLRNMGKKLFKCLAASLPGIPQSLAKNSYNYGKIYKKSQILGRWQQRLIVINKQGIYSYKKFNEKHSMFISSFSIKEIWTRFEVEDQLLVIKILHSSTKTEFGLPLTELLDRRAWLFSFYLLAFPK